MDKPKSFWRTLMDTPAKDVFGGGVTNPFKMRVKSETIVFGMIMLFGIVIIVFIFGFVVKTLTAIFTAPATPTTIVNPDNSTTTIMELGSSLPVSNLFFWMIFLAPAMYIFYRVFRGFGRLYD